ncbi:GGDEF domain-containing protein [Roseococcus pinisoli]|uniref:Diguanylate cyclase n=1 Tax=Roseococcus pinisoli TaxID=2835040 RepID=A0ABS5QDZ9_9PROT|nr:diguanylate cyclase [Roseococcus pinisoli]MBS7811147.1 diguanylate cyclase [Roseococcus pinisoli]
MMTPDDLAFLALRSLACILCFYAGWRSFRQAYTYREHHERFVRAVFGGVLAVLLGVLAIAIGLWEAFVRPGDPIGFKEWIYTVILIVLPAFFLNLLDSFAQRDVLERKLAEAAYHDSLTGLPNRAGHAALAGYALAQSHAAGRPASIATLDVDHFKSINDGWGHAAGDAVLRAIASSLRQNLRDGDVVSRAGGEEFNILLRRGADRGAAPRRPASRGRGTRCRASRRAPGAGFDLGRRRPGRGRGARCHRGSDAAGRYRALRSQECGPRPRGDRQPLPLRKGRGARGLTGPRGPRLSPRIRGG